MEISPEIIAEFVRAEEARHFGRPHLNTTKNFEDPVPHICINCGRQLKDLFATHCNTRECAEGSTR